MVTRAWGKAAVLAVALLMAALAALLAFAPGAAWADAELAAADVTGAQAMYRMYNPNSGEHFYTADVNERNTLINVGWHYEGVGWTAPTTGYPVYRLYNPNNGGDHHYTKDSAERDMLIGVGWRDEQIGWYSAGEDGAPVRREYNPNELARNHNYTADAAEHNTLVGLGWHDEQIGWYGLPQATFEAPYVNPDTITVPGDFNHLEQGAFVGTLVKRESVHPTIETYYNISFDQPVSFAVGNSSWIKWSGKQTFTLSEMQVAWVDSGYRGGDYVPVDRTRADELNAMVGQRVIAFGTIRPSAGSPYYGTDVILSGSDVYLYPQV